MLDVDRLDILVRGVCEIESELYAIASKAREDQDNIAFYQFLFCEKSIPNGKVRYGFRDSENFGS